jgi:ABC-2 type transport system ATP-binding protein
MANQKLIISRSNHRSPEPRFTAASPALARSLHSCYLIGVYDYHKAYRDNVAVASLSFEVQPGQILGLLGPNGAGKTTTMRAISGIIAPTSGRLAVDGHDVVREPVAAKLALAYVPDDPHLFDALTVWEHLEFIASAYRIPDFDAPAVALLERFQLADQRNTIAQELSRGMRQKVAICCAYLHKPKAILFDEPMTGLDPRGIRTMKETVVERAKAGAAFLISSHLLALVEDLCTHLLILHHGRCLFVGPMQHARSAFANAGIDASLEELFFRATENVPPVSNPC